MKRGEKMQIKLTIEQLEKMLKMAKNQAEYHNMRSVFLVSISELPTGDPELEFEQPCSYAECNSTCYCYR